MALKILLTSQMVELSTSVLASSGPYRKVLDGIEGSATPRRQVERAVAGLIAAQPPPDTVAARLSVEMGILDYRHDTGVRCILYRIDSEIEVADEATKEALIALRSALFPAGASIVQRTYVEEAGEAKLRAARVTPEMRKLLGKMKLLDGRTCDNVYELVQTSAERLGVGEQRRAMLGADGELVLKTSTARGQWIRAINALSAFLLAEGVDEMTVLAPIRNAEAAAEKSRGGGDTDTDTDPGVTPVPAPNGDQPVS